jgi:hypothetical protein
MRPHAGLARVRQMRMEHEGETADFAHRVSSEDRNINWVIVFIK